MQNLILKTMDGGKQWESKDCIWRTGVVENQRIRKNPDNAYWNGNIFSGA